MRRGNRTKRARRVPVRIGILAGKLKKGEGEYKGRRFSSALDVSRYVTADDGFTQIDPGKRCSTPFRGRREIHNSGLYHREKEERLGENFG